MEGLESFSLYLIDTKKCSVSTHHSYLHDVTKFLQYCTDHRLAARDVDSSFVYDYLAYLQGQAISDATAMRVLAALRCYYSFLQKYGEVSENPIKDIRLSHKARRKMPEILTQKEISMLLAQPDGDDFKSCRDRAMLELMYATGIKVSELIDLTLSDVNLSVGIIHLHSAKHERIIPVYDKALHSLEYYIKTVRPAVIFDSSESRLFTNMSGQPLSRQGFWKIVKSYAKRVNITKDITPLSFRHSFAMHLLENGAELTDIKEMLGHADISSTNIYAQLVNNKYALAYRKFHPMVK